MNALKADPRTVDLRSLAPHFYRLGVRILQLFEEEEIMEVLSDVGNTVSCELCAGTCVNGIFLYCRHLSNGRCKSPTMRIIPPVSWG